jgi:hypothetical protein
LGELNNQLMNRSKCFEDILNNILLLKQICHKLKKNNINMLEEVFKIEFKGKLKRFSDSKIKSMGNRNKI